MKTNMKSANEKIKDIIVKGFYLQYSYDMTRESKSQLCTIKMGWKGMFFKNNYNVF